MADVLVPIGFLTLIRGIYTTHVDVSMLYMTGWILIGSFILIDIETKILSFFLS